MIRNIVQIDEKLCNGCGKCAHACHEDAIIMVDGKAKLIKDDYCDGLGDCLPACPANAISIVEREAEAYDEEAVKKRMEEKKKGANSAAGNIHMCPGTMAKSLKINETKASSISINKPVQSGESKSRLRQWPVQIKLVPLKADYYDNADLLIAADCTAYAYASFHEDFINGCITLIGCPKLDEGNYSEKLGEIIKGNNIKSVKIVRMEVPCCGGLQRAVEEAVKNSGKSIPCDTVTISCDGKVI